MRHLLILRVTAKLIIPLILLFALYVQFHGDYGPGGGFQAGVLFAAGFILYGLIFDLDHARQVAPPALLPVLMAVGLLIYAAVGVYGLLRAGISLNTTSWPRTLCMASIWAYYSLSLESASRWPPS